MGLSELVTAMQQVLRQAEAQLAHVPVLDRSRDAWQTVADRFGDTSDQLSHASAAVSACWPDDVGARCSERMDGSATTVRDWRETLAAAGLPEVVTALAAAVGTTVDGVRQLWNVFTQTLGQLGIVGADPGAVEAALAAIVSRANAMMGELDQRFAEAAERVSRAAAGTAWDGPGAGTASDGAGAGTASGGPGAGTAPGGPGAGTAQAAGGGGGGASPRAATSPAIGGGAGTGLGASPIPAASRPFDVPSPLTPDPSFTPSLAGAAPTLSPLSPSPSPALGSGGGIPGSPGGGIGIGPLMGGGAVPRAGRTPTGSVPTASGMAPAATGATPAGTAATRAAGGRFVPPFYGAGRHGRGGGHNGEAKPGDEASAHRARPVQDVPGVPPELRGRTASLAATPGFLTGPSGPDDEPDPIREDYWHAERPPNPFTPRGSR
ncbi:hypothetical protein [Actinoplanes sp. NPDC049265]|uniref:hypothetical protein n=1 Tax=Actinoplanes sp. NPDC049265 TaxID=3363902 RepID=UPI0037214142